MNPTQEERELFDCERSDYAALLETIRRPIRPTERSFLQMTCIGNSGGATSVVRGDPTGGFLLRYRGRTLIIDPGDNSMSNLVRSGFDPFEITDVLASHSHNDHAGDLSLAVSAAINLGLPADIDSRIVVAPSLVDYDNPDATKFGFTLPAYAWKANVDVLFCREAQATRYDGEIVNALRETHLDGEIRVTATEARHSATSTTGFVFDTPAGRIGYTSDTEYFDGLSNWFEAVDVLWMNMNTLALDSMVPARDISDAAQHMTHNHLGYAGVCQLIEEVRPKTAVVTHFGAQLVGKHLDIQVALRKRFRPLGVAVYCPETGDRFEFARTLRAEPICHRGQP